MKNYTLPIFLLSFLISSISIQSQNVLDYKAFYHFEGQQLSSVDTIPGFDSKKNKLKLYGTIYKSDGVTPASDVILYIEQADENGNFDIRKKDDEKYIHNRGWVKTDSNGNYSFFTYIPGNDRRYNQMQQIFPIIKESAKPEYEIASLLFDEDPLLTKLCRKRMTKKGDITRILKLKLVDGIFESRKDITLIESVALAE